MRGTGEPSAAPAGVEGGSRSTHGVTGTAGRPASDVSTPRLAPTATHFLFGRAFALAVVPAAAVSWRREAARPASAARWRRSARKDIGASCISAKRALIALRSSHSL